MQLSHFCLCLAALLFSTTSFSHILPHAKNQIHPRDTLPASKQCGYSGNTEIYGLGIRLGLYLQWAAGFLAGLLRKDASESAVEIQYSHLLFAMAIFLAVVTPDTSSTAPLDIVILFFMYFGGLLTVTFGVYPHAFNPKDGGAVENASRKHRLAIWLGIFVTFGTSLYATWFWWKGIRERFEIDPACTYHMFIIWVKVPISAHGRGTGQMFISAFSIIFSVLWFMAIVSNFYISIGNRPSTRTEGEMGQLGDEAGANTEKSVDNKTEEVQSPDEPHPGEQGPSRPSKRRSNKGWNKVNDVARYGAPFAGFACLVYTINAIELMLVWNEITDTNHIDSIGQLFPLVVGAFTLVELLLKNLPDRWKIKLDWALSLAGDI
ncbi:hypothetical protein BDZ45DRAFT_24228 [Acephala macrosclerotiorum]|nr:hypothetical protein BDZ45DRAFT_24228 [Acephala macrosclerotiorum]